MKITIARRRVTGAHVVFCVYGLGAFENAVILATKEGETWSAIVD